jgi:hypothetical protein
VELSDFKYTTSFACTAISTVLSKQDAWLAKASVDNLKKIIPSFALDNQFDLLPIAFNSCVVNLGNLNGDLIDTDTALAVYHQFAHRPINIEHNRANCVGHLIGGALSSFNVNYKEGFGSEILAEDDVIGKLDPFNISLSGFIYKVVDPELVDLIVEASNPLSENHLQISASWELAFSDFDILLGSPLMSKGEVIKDPALKSEYYPYTRAGGGDGKYKDGQDVYRIVRGRVVPLGIGLTTTPAGAVAGVVAATSSEGTSDAAVSIEPNSSESLIPETVVQELAATVILENQEEIGQTKNIISQLETNFVNTHSIMRLKDITDENLKDLSLAKIQEIISEEAKASYKSALSEAIEDASNKYAAKLDEQEKAAKAKAEETEAAKSELEALKDEFNKVKSALEAEQQARAQEQAESDFGARMGDLNEKYNLTDEDKAIIAKQIRGLDEQGYAGWLSDWAVIAKAKNKANAQQAAASVEDALDNLRSQNSSVPNAEDLSSKKLEWAKAFKLEDLISK